MIFAVSGNNPTWVRCTSCKQIGKRMGLVGGAFHPDFKLISGRHSP